TKRFGSALKGTVPVFKNVNPVGLVSQGGSGETAPTVSFYGGGPVDRSLLDPTAVAAGPRSEEIPPPSAEIVQEEDDSEESSILDEWWFWTAAGVVALGVAGGAYFAFVYDRPIDGVSVEAVW
ncbi:MAG: hypothetical protein AAFQ82_08370, partial [Myxococcota bacterium]